VAALRIGLLGARPQAERLGQREHAVVLEQHRGHEALRERQLQSLVPATYFLLTFTLPSRLRRLACGHQQALYALLMQCAWDTLATFSRKDRHLRATPGAVGVLHTHNRRLDFHPHVNMVMPAAALDTERGLWRTKCRRSKRRRLEGGHAKAATTATAGSGTSGGGYLFNHKARAKVFRAKVLDAIQAAGLTLPDKLPAVDCKAVGDGSQALLYLSRFLYRGVVQEADILSCKDGQVSFRYRDAKTGRQARRRLPGADFLCLVLQHLLPKGLRRARNFGFLHPNSLQAVRLLQVLHLRSQRPLGAHAAVPTRPAWRCACGQPMAVLRRRMPAEVHNAANAHPVVHDIPNKSGPTAHSTMH
jgi:hypothetical protein